MMLQSSSIRSLEWRRSLAPVAYETAIAEMEDRVAAIRQGSAPELIWLLEHPCLYTAGVSAKAEDMLTPDRFPVYRTGRGGQLTYHGPGQRVIYAMLDLERRDRDIRAHIHRLEEWIVRSLAVFGIQGERRCGRVGIWVVDPRQMRESKIAAIGVRIRRWVAYHGAAINIAPDLSHFQGIVPCGIRDYNVTSLLALGCEVSMSDFDRVLIEQFDAVFS